MSRILVVTNLYPPHYLGGYELACRDVVDRWRARGHDVEVLTSTLQVPGKPGDPTPHVHRTLRVAIDSQDLLTPPLRTRRTIEAANQSALAAALREHHPDVVSVWSMAGMSTGLLTSLQRLGVPLVYVISDDWPTFAVKLDPWMRMWANRGPLGSLVERLSGVPATLPPLGATGTFCFISKTTRQRCSRRADYPDATVTWSGIDLNDFPLATPGSEVERPWSWRLLYAGRLDPRKGVDVAVRSLSLLPAAATLRVLAPVDAPYRIELEELAADLGVAGRVTFGFAERRDLAEAYRQADALLFPTVWDEPFGYVPIEAMACDTPVVATGTGGSGEFLIDGRTCVRTHPGDPRSLAAGLERLAADPALRRRLVDAGRHVAAELNVDRWAEVLEAWHLAAAARFAGGRPQERRLPDGLGLGGG